MREHRHLLLQLRDRQLLGLPLVGVAAGSMVLVVACLMLLPQVLGHRQHRHIGLIGGSPR